MPTIPTPFIGGAGGPQADRAHKDEVAPPFFTENARVAAEPAQEPAAEPDTAASGDELVDLVLTEVVSEEGPFETLDSVIEEEEAPIETLAEEVAPGETVEAPEEADELIDLVFTELAAGAQEASPEEQAFASEPATEPEPFSGAADFGTDEEGSPDFLAGPDSIGPDEFLAETAAAPEPPAGADEIANEAQALLAGALGDWIRQLTAELGPGADETAISRAFAAGYLAARAEEEKQ